MTPRRAGGGGIPEADLLKLLRVSDGAVLIGGQALAFWVAYLGVPIPPGPRAFISADADFLGSAQHAEGFSRAIGGRAEYPSRRQLTALQGMVTKRTKGGERIVVDVLHSVVGIDAEGVRRRALDVSHPGDPRLRFRVMSPIDCLVSRLENLRQLADRQNAVGVWQADLGIAVCRAYVEKLIALGDERQAIRAATRILGIAGAAPGLQAFRRHGLEPLAAVPVDRFASRAFREEQYARTIARIHALRAAYRRPPAKQTPPR